MEQNYMLCTINLDLGTTKQMFLFRRKRNKSNLHLSVHTIQEITRNISISSTAVTNDLLHFCTVQTYVS